MYGANQKSIADSHLNRLMISLSHILLYTSSTAEMGHHGAWDIDGGYSQ